MLRTSIPGDGWSGDLDGDVWVDSAEDRMLRLVRPWGVLKMGSWAKAHIWTRIRRVSWGLEPSNMRLRWRPTSRVWVLVT